MVLGEKKLITFSYQYELDIILENYNCNSIYLSCEVTIRVCRGWYSIFAGLAARFTASAIANVATRFTNGKANGRANNRATGLATSKTNG